MNPALLSALMLSSNPSYNEDLLQEISSTRLKKTVEKLASFTTRNTNSPELEKAAAWVADEFRKIPGLQVELMRYTVQKSTRILETREVVQVIAKLPGETDRIVMVGGHLDSLNLAQGADVRTVRAPGANDDGSGVALTLELARVLARQRWKNTLVFVAFTGEEQGLLGSKALAKKAKEENWKIEAFLNNDTVGSSRNKLGQHDPLKVRVFSELSEEHSSRELARWIEWQVRRSEWSQKSGFGIKLVFRKDRFRRGGDHSPFNEQGFTAVRFVEAHEEYSRQHTLDDLPEHMDFEHLAQVVRANLLSMATLASADEPPTNVRIEMKQGYDTHLRWEARPGVSYRVYWRDTTSPIWQGHRDVGEVDETILERIHKDDHDFAVSAIGGIPVPVKS